MLRHKNVDSDGKLQIKPKDEVKEVLGRSPDIGDMIIMRMWFEIKKDALNENDPVQQVVISRQREMFQENKFKILNSSSK